MIFLLNLKQANHGIINYIFLKKIFIVSHQCQSEFNYTVVNKLYFVYKNYVMKKNQHIFD